MFTPGTRFQKTKHYQNTPKGLQLIAALTGFADAGHTVAQLKEHLLDNLDYEIIVEFNNDQLLDYRARRPAMYFDSDHLTDYEPAELDLYWMRDDLGHSFLLLAGYEPDYQWEGFIKDLLDLIVDLGVCTTTWINSIPMPVPHTRPIGATVSGNRAELIDALSVWRPRTHIPANALHLLEYRLQQYDAPVAGLSLLIPHYLSDNQYPSGPIAALDKLSAATGLIFPLGKLPDKEKVFFTKLSEQVENSSELSIMISGLEQRHDQYMEINSFPPPLVQDEEELPSADDIAAELEQFLSLRRESDDKKDG